MKKINLRSSEKQWEVYGLESPSIKEEFKKRNITIGVEIKIGNGVKVENNVEIGNDVVIGDDVSIGNYVIIGDEVVIGNNATIGNNVIIGRNAIIEANDVITKEETFNIAGTMYDVIFWSRNMITIGCMTNSIDWWLENYKIVGIKYKFSEEEIEEYKGYILKCHNLQNKSNGKQ